jgi:hypothetical protein
MPAAIDTRIFWGDIVGFVYYNGGNATMVKGL